LNYARDTDIPKHRVNWNWIVDLPAGQGKILGHNAHGFVNTLVGPAGTSTGIVKLTALYDRPCTGHRQRR